MINFASGLACRLLTGRQINQRLVIRLTLAMSGSVTATGFTNDTVGQLAANVASVQFTVKVVVVLLTHSVHLAAVNTWLLLNDNYNINTDPPLFGLGVLTGDATVSSSDPFQPAESKTFAYTDEAHLLSCAHAQQIAQNTNNPTILYFFNVTCTFYHKKHILQLW